MSLAGIVIAIALPVVVVATAMLGWMEYERRTWVVSRAVDGGACRETVHLRLAPPTPTASRELFMADAACRGQIKSMLAAAPNFRCRSSGALTVCEHPLNAADSTTYVRAVIDRERVMLMTSPT